jgi:RND family efflux transporter MFP subunit
MKRIKGLIGLALVAGLAGFGGFRLWQVYEHQSAVKAKDAAKKGGARVVTVRVAEARVGAIRQELLLAGALKPKELVEVNAKVTGRVQKLNFQIGDRVKRGDLIALLEDDELVQQVNRAMASLTVAKAAAAQREAELANSRADLVRFEALFREGLVPQRDLEAHQTAARVVESQLQLARAQQAQATAELNELKIRREQTRIVAPMNGWVARRHVDVGALVSPSTPILTLVNLATMVTLASVPEREVGALRVGMEAEVHLDAFGDRLFTGHVARVSPVLDAATRSALVEIEIPNPDGRLKAEMFARVKLNTASTRQTVLIPREALVYRGEQPGVYIVREGAPEFRAIETGTMQGDLVEALTNLQPGTRIVATGASMLTEGDRIRVVGEGKGGGEGKGRKKKSAAE